MSSSSANGRRGTPCANSAQTRPSPEWLLKSNSSEINQLEDTLLEQDGDWSTSNQSGRDTYRLEAGDTEPTKIAGV